MDLPLIPAPSYLSAAARTALTQRLPDIDYPAQEDEAAWLRLIRLVDDSVLAHSRPIPAWVRIESLQVGAVPVFVQRSEDVEPNGPILLDFHGGGLIFGGGRLIPVQAAHDLLQIGLERWSPDYRMPPLHPFPAGIDDAVSVYRHLLTVRDPSGIIVSGGSGGGNIAASMLLRAKDQRLPMPAGLILLAPELDLTESGDSFLTLNAASSKLHSLMPVNRLYAGAHALDEPLVSPLFGDVSAFPPTSISVGTRDLFLSNAVRMHRRLCNAGVVAELNVFDAMPHGGFGDAPEDADLTTTATEFAHRVLLAAAAGTTSIDGTQ